MLKKKKRRLKWRKYFIAEALILILEANRFLPDWIVARVLCGYTEDERIYVEQRIDRYVKKHGGGYR